MSRPLHPGETVLYDSDPTITLKVEDTAEDMALAFFERLADLFDTPSAEAAFRAALAYRDRRPGGRRRRPEEVTFDALLIREHRRAMAGGLTDAKATASVARSLAGAADPFGKSRSADTIKRRLRGLRAKAAGTP